MCEIGKNGRMPVVPSFSSSRMRCASALLLAHACGARAGETMPGEYLLRSTWEGKSAAEHETMYAPLLRQLCPKALFGSFFYPKIKRRLRGLMAMEEIKAGEVVCEVKVDDMLTQHAITNSSLHPMVPEFSTRNHGEQASLAQVLRTSLAQVSHKSRTLPLLTTCHAPPPHLTGRTFSRGGVGAARYLCAPRGRAGFLEVHAIHQSPHRLARVASVALHLGG